jgi:hypothetical protein
VQFGLRAALQPLELSISRGLETLLSGSQASAPPRTLLDRICRGLAMPSACRASVNSWGSRPLTEMCSRPARCGLSPRAGWGRSHASRNIRDLWKWHPRLDPGGVGAARRIDFKILKFPVDDHVGERSATNIVTLPVLDVESRANKCVAIAQLCKGDVGPPRVRYLRIPDAVRVRRSFSQGFADSDLSFRRGGKSLDDDRYLSAS